MQDLSNSLPIVSSRLMGRLDKGYAGSPSVSGLRSRACMLPSWWEVVHSKIVLNTFTGKNITLCGRCFMGLFGILFGPGTWPTLRPWMAPELPWDWLIQARLQEQRSVLTLIRQPSQGMPVLMGHLMVKTGPPECQPGLQLSQNLTDTSVTMGGGEGVELSSTV